MTSCDRTEWTPFRPDVAVVAALASGLGISRVTAQVLAARGITSVEEAGRFLSPSLTRDWPQTAAVPGLTEAAARVAAAVRAGESIVMFGDFDLDGISAAATAALGLRALGADVTATVPHRFREGYGLTPAANERLLAMRPDLVVTVDCGISGGREVAWLIEHGIDVVVTDHHEASECVPEGVPVADPKLIPDGPELAGAGVALALVRAAGELLGGRERWRELTDLAMLGTVSD
ncbi:MAG TPA: DHH family phosphoesterase, partial [Coriobacteriia bacterium]|nr:DHH family phosphoesterase [Coriobacteriia bacterium]